MDKFGELLQGYVNKDYFELVAKARQDIVSLFPACKVVDKDNDGFVMMTSIMLSAIGADGTLTALERKFMKDALEIDDDAVSKFIKMYNGKMVELTDSFADALPVELKADVIDLALCIVAVDEKISREETAFIAKLIAQ